MTPSKSHGRLYDIAAHCTCMSNHTKAIVLVALVTFGKSLVLSTSEEHQQKKNAEVQWNPRRLFYP